MTWDSLRRGLGFPEPENEARGTREFNEVTDTELAEEYAPFTGMQPSPFEGAYQLAPDNGITVSPVPVTFGQQVEVRYNGLLAQSGADSVILHYGFGPGSWRKVQDVAMTKTPEGYWRAQVPIDDSGRFSFCFKDTAGNWDNNFGRNWTYVIHGAGEH